ncbi:hypothetical protein AXX12_09975 [Anaerosporomusa subterranea]|uniref:Uncharacterized protein n=1 Tax=Anaerosporomusa subterranea TaxID=1794912 RepID=A0A154BS40_ANASB|nr:hypothetical protein [Anaerosporomusa subterranea]KYZ76729.1 hypothetical protein AXX12_09975 [Anaerosporomusa subterranea]
MTSFFDGNNRLENYRIQGLFDFSRIMRYDPYEVNLESLIYIQVHETTHFCLTTSTIYGNIHYMIDQLSWRIQSKAIQFDHISEELLKASRHVHEAVATFSEYATIKASENEEFYQNKLKELFKNREYYNYVWRLVKPSALIRNTSLIMIWP